MIIKEGAIQAPLKTVVVPTHAQWLGGQGVGTWFCIDATLKKNQYQIRRYTPEGALDCDRIFEIEQNGMVFDITIAYQFTYISHCATCRIIQEGKTFTFNHI